MIEMITAAAIIGILASIGVSQYASYRQKAYESQIKQSLMDAAAAEHAFLATNGSYKSGSLTSGDPPGLNKTEAVTLTATTGTDSYQLTATHAQCGSTTWTLNSTDGTISGGPCTVDIPLLPKGCS